MLASQVVFPDVAERSVLSALLLMLSGGALGLQLLGIGSACFLFLAAAALFVALSLDALLNSNVIVSLWTYALGLVVPLLIGTRMTCIVLDVFVPLVCSHSSRPDSARKTIHIIDWTYRRGRSCRAHHRIYRCSHVTPHRTTRYTVLATVFAQGTDEHGHYTEYRDCRRYGSICSPFALR
jgi:hypothetical protein